MNEDYTDEYTPGIRTTVFNHISQTFRSTLRFLPCVTEGTQTAVREAAVARKLGHLSAYLTAVKSEIETISKTSTTQSSASDDVTTLPRLSHKRPCISYPH